MLQVRHGFCVKTHFHSVNKPSNSLLKLFCYRPNYDRIFCRIETAWIFRRWLGVFAELVRILEMALATVPF
jgi:hypothetical protein